ncbi:hypothetical protein [Chryseobacterium indologenes]|uniref:hypothetical protein n=1 Tax=Chryseobacterium indologenes TaxID=253 RepID=UPI0011AB53A8|nr:hypothetical protein [Chryseobacterium indologenes]
MMKKNLLLTSMFVIFSLVAKSQVGINTANPQGIFSVDGLKNNPRTGIPSAAQAKDDLVMSPNGNLGIGIITPGTTLDVNGAITNRETVLAVSGNNVTVPSNVSQVQLTGNATGTITINAFAAPNAGQRLIVFNNTSGGFGATLDGVTVPNGKALEYVFSNSYWRSTDGGSIGVSSSNIGDIKASFSVSDHSGWVKLDGRPVGGLTSTQRTAANSLGFTSYIPNATDSYLVQDGKRMGSINSNNSRIISRNQLPNFQLSGTTNSAEPTIMYDIINNNGRPATDTFSYTFLAGKIGTGTRNLDHVNTNVLHQNPHSHSFNTNSVNGGVAQQSINVQPQSLSVNMFVYLGK